MTSAKTCLTEIICHRWTAMTVGWIKTTYPGTAQVRHKADFHRTCPALCPSQTRCWSRNRRSWCSYHCQAADSQPATSQLSCIRCPHAKFTVNMNNKAPSRFARYQVLPTSSGVPSGQQSQLSRNPLCSVDHPSCLLSHNGYTGNMVSNRMVRR